MYKMEIVIKVPLNEATLDILKNLLAIVVNFLDGLDLKSTGVVYEVEVNDDSQN